MQIADYQAVGINMLLHGEVKWMDAQIVMGATAPDNSHVFGSVIKTVTF